MLYKDEDELFVDGMDDEDSEEEKSLDGEMKMEPVNLKTSFRKEESMELPGDEKKASRNPLKKLFQSVHEKAMDKATATDVGAIIVNSAERVQVNMNEIVRNKSKPRQKSSSRGKLKKAFLSLTNKAKNAGQKASNIY